MRTKLLKRVAGYLLYGVVFYLIFAYVAGMPMRWSIVLALLFTSIERRLLHVAPKPVRRFTAHYITVHPKWYEILADYKMVNGLEDWNKIEDSWQERPRSEYVFLRDGISLVIVSQSDDFERTLIYSHNHHTFGSDIDIREDLCAVTTPYDDTLMQERFGAFQSDFFMKEGSGGYDVGIVVHAEWWAKAKGTCPKPLDEKPEHLYGTVKLTLAKIPLQEFAPYWEPVEYDLTWRGRVERVQREGREKFGWTNKEP